MKHFVTSLLLISAFLVYSCGPKIEKVIEKTYPDGKPEVEKHYIKEGDNRILQKEIVYWPTEKKKIEGSYKEEQRDGHWIAWFENGNKWSEGYYIKGIEDGEKRVWHENGNVFFEGQYKMGVKVGIWKVFDEAGNLVQEINYDEKNKE
jgi:antitoxin component YwqK of YwqJK toxin-antitoxin module